MLARSNRLRKASDISRVYKKGAYGGSAGVLSVKSLASGRTDSRVVVVVGKKVDKRAVVRNRIRRRLIGILRERLATVRPGYDIVVNVHSDVSQLPQQDLAGHMDRAFAKLGIVAS